MPATAMKLRILRFLGGSAVTSMVLIGCNGDTHPRAGGMAGGNGASATGGTSTGAVGGTDTPGNCWTVPSVGTCCNSVVCFSRAEVAARITSDPSDADAGPIDFSGRCPSRLPQAGFCTFYDSLDSETEHECCYVETTGTCCGRPFIVGGVARQASVRTRADWGAGPDIGAIAALADARTRAELARAWLADARLEHASIASFARFTLHLLELGAPAELVGDAQRAGLDEVEHARLCFALASRYAGQPLGPGGLAAHASAAPVTLAEAAAAAVREGCVGETLAALQVQAQLERASDPQVRAALVRIADDEARHAELAWHFARWAIGAGDASVRAAVANAFDAGLAELRARGPVRDLHGVALDAWHAHGRLTPAEEHACQLETARAVIEPCAQALLHA